MALSDSLLARIAEARGASSARAGAHIQTLWSGYGEILRVELAGADVPSVVVKQVDARAAVSHKRGWNTDRSHKRKLRSYDVEMAWYRSYAQRCDDACRVPQAWLTEGGGGSWLFVLEDLDASGFPGRRASLERASEEGALLACLDWLAEFHATFMSAQRGGMGAQCEGLWSTGTYWHLATRPDELAAMDDGRLRAAAGKLDARLSQCAHRTLVHGDAKVANFCFSQDGARVAAVDFQYVGGGCGMKDVAYFLSSCLDSDACEARADDLLDHYFASLDSALSRRRPEIDGDTRRAIEAAWRALYPLAWADFYRFLAGWAPGHYKIHGYSRRMTEEALAAL